MANLESQNGRRKALKSIAGTSGVLIAAKNMPESWSKPIVDAVLLPAHASTTFEVEGGPTPPPTYNCGSLTEDQASGQESGDIAIVFDGGTNCSLTEFNQQSGVPANAVTSFDSDLFENLLWDDIGEGSNWSRVATNIPGPDNNSNGSYYVDVTRDGKTYRVSFSVVVASGVAGPPYATGTMSINGVTIVQK